MLTGISTATATTILAADTVLVALGKAQGQINANTTAISGKEPAITAGTTSQYWRGDKTWQTLPSSGGGLTWVDLTVLTANGFASGFASGTIVKLQIAKDTDGYVWIRGVIRNTSGAANTNAPVVLPTAYMIRVQNTSASISSTALISNLNGTDTPVALQTYYFDASTQLINKSGSWVTNGVYFVAPSILGIALNP